MPSPATEHIPTADELRTARPGQSLRDQCDAIRGAIDAHHWAAVNVSVPQTFTGGVSRSAADGRAFQAHQQHQGELEQLLRQLSSTPEAREVDWSQARCSGDQAYPRAAGARSRVLGPEQRVAAWVAERGSPTRSTGACRSGRCCAAG